MHTKTRIPIQPLKDLAKKFGLSHVILLAHQEASGLDHVVTYGETVEQCSQAADFGNRLKEVLGWPASMFAQPSRVKRLEQEIERYRSADKRLVAEFNELANREAWLDKTLRVAFDQLIDKQRAKIAEIEVILRGKLDEKDRNQFEWRIAYFQSFISELELAQKKLDEQINQQAEILSNVRSTKESE